MIDVKLSSKKVSKFTKNLQSLMTKIKSKAKFNERFNINTKNLKDEERLPKMYEHVGKAFIHRSKRSDEWRIATSLNHCNNKEQRTKN